MNIMKKVWIGSFILYMIYVVTEIFLYGYHLINSGESFHPPGRYYIAIVGRITFLVGIYGLVSSKKIFNPLFWRITFFCMLAIEIPELSLIVDSLRATWWAPVLLLVSIIGFIANFVYSFRSKKLWV